MPAESHPKGRSAAILKTECRNHFGERDYATGLQNSQAKSTREFNRD